MEKQPRKYHRTRAAAAIFAAIVAAQTDPVHRTEPSRGPHIYSLEPVPVSDVDITDEFWAPKMIVNRTVSIQHLFRKFGDRGFDNPRLIEAASYMVAKSRDPELTETLESMVDREIAALPARLQHRWPLWRNRSCGDCR